MIEARERLRDRPIALSPGTAAAAIRDRRRYPRPGSPS